MLVLLRDFLVLLMFDPLLVSLEELAVVNGFHLSLGLKSALFVPILVDLGLDPNLVGLILLQPLVAP